MSCVSKMAQEQSKLEKYRQKLPDIAAKFEAMTREELIEACCGEGLDAIAMQERVSLFMEECTHMSYTTYPVDKLRTMIQERKESDIDQWCADFIDDEDTDEDIVKAVKERGQRALG